MKAYKQLNIVNPVKRELNESMLRKATEKAKLQQDLAPQPTIPIPAHLFDKINIKHE